MEEREVPSESQLLTPVAALLVEASSEGQSKEDGDICDRYFKDLGEFPGEFSCGEWLPPCGEDETGCWSICDVPSLCKDINLMDSKLLQLELHLRFLIGIADESQSELGNRLRLLAESPGQFLDSSEKKVFVDKVRNLLHTSQHYFRYLESMAWSHMPPDTPPPTYICSRLLDFSQQLCMRLEQLVLYYAGNNILSVDQTEPDSLSHFYIGQCQIDRVMVTMFRYCGPVPFEFGADTGMYTRMRWNVERHRDADHLLQTDPDHHREPMKEETATVSDTEYFFLCYEDTPDFKTQINHENGLEEIIAMGGVVRKWTIGQWIQTHPDPETETIDDWVLCLVPQGRYNKLLCLDSKEEPSTHHATNCLLEILFKGMTGENSCSIPQTPHLMT